MKQTSADKIEQPASGSPRRKRDAEDWSNILMELASQLATGRFYNRDLAKIDAAMVRLVTVYNRRMDGCRALTRLTPGVHIRGIVDLTEWVHSGMTASHLAPNEPRSRAIIGHAAEF